MLPLGYMAKKVVKKPDWLKVEGVTDILSVCTCISEDFCDHVNYWRHNGWWMFNSPEDIYRLAMEIGVEMKGTDLFYYEGYENEFNEEANRWNLFFPEAEFKTDIQDPGPAELKGFDIVSYSQGNLAECSPLSCNKLAESLPVNRHCLLPTLEDAKDILNAGLLTDCEPGPYRILAVYQV